MFISGSPRHQDYGRSLGSSAPTTVTLAYRLEAPEDWGDGAATMPDSVTVQIGKTFSGEGHASTLRRMYDRATLFAFLANVVLAVLALMMFCMAAAIVMFAPAEKHSLIPWIALPPSIVSFGLGGFAVFRLSLAGTGISVVGGSQITGNESGKSVLF